VSHVRTRRRAPLADWLEWNRGALKLNRFVVVDGLCVFLSVMRTVDGRLVESQRILRRLFYVALNNMGYRQSSLPIRRTIRVLESRGGGQTAVRKLRNCDSYGALTWDISVRR